MHTMKMIHVYDDGNELWVCLECERKILIQWQPWKKDVLMEGDPTAMHSGGKGGVEIGSVEVVDPRMEPFDNFMKGIP